MEQTAEAIVMNEGTPIKKRRKWPLILLLVLVTLLAASYAGLCYYAHTLAVFFPNHIINDVPVGGMSTSDAQSAVEKALRGQVVSVYDAAAPNGDAVASLTLDTLGFSSENAAGWAEAAMNHQQSIPIWQKGWAFGYAYLGYGTEDWNPYTLSGPVFEKAVQSVARQLSFPAVDAAYVLEDHTLSVVKAKDGRTTDISALQESLSRVGLDTVPRAEVTLITVPAKEISVQEIYDSYDHEMKNAGYDKETGTITPDQTMVDFDVSALLAQLDALPAGETLAFPVEIELPIVTAAELETVLFRDVLGECRTHVSGTAARIANVQLSAAAINEYVMNSGEVFSYNEAVGERTAANGYQPAPAYVKGETVDEIGGGICQTSSTLYYACLLANLEITERYAHRYVPAYILWGADATVSWGGPDYKFTNSTLYPVKIVTEYSNGYVTVRLLGTKVDDVTVKLTNKELSSTPWETVYEVDPSLPPGTEQEKTSPYIGHKVELYQHFYDGEGKWIATELENTSNYKARNRVILHNPVVSDPALPTVLPGEIPSAEPPAAGTETPAPEATEPSLYLDWEGIW